MGWKDWSYARKGGVIGILFELLLFLVGYLFLKFVNNEPSSFLSWFIIPLALPMALAALTALFSFNILNCNLCFSKGPLEQPCVNTNYCEIIPNLVSIFSTLIYSFLLGALIGWLIGKIKSKNQIKN